MKLKAYRVYFFILPLIIAGLFIAFGPKANDNLFITYIANPHKQTLRLYYKNQKQQRYGSIQNLKNQLEQTGDRLIFAMNGGMYKKDGSPQGLYIEKGKELCAIDTVTNAKGNFYLHPNGIFYIDVKNNAAISSTENFKNKSNIKYATQSGPMLIINGQIHDAFKEGSTNLQIRNGVGLLPDNKVLFAMSREPVNFYDFASYFKSMGCANALYLDGFVSRTYLPEQDQLQTDGDFGVIIGVTVK